MEIFNENNKKTACIIFNILLFICVGTGLALIIIKFDLLSALFYFTVQSNILCMIMAGITLVYAIKKNKSKNGAYVFFKGMALVSILLTFFVYNFILKPFVNDQSEPLYSILLHLVVPLMMLGDYLFFEEKVNFKIWYPFGWALFPVFYAGFIALYNLGGLYKLFGDTSVKFPYFFLDYQTYGLVKVGLWVLLIAACFIAFSFLLLVFNNILLRRKINKTC